MKNQIGKKNDAREVKINFIKFIEKDADGSRRKKNQAESNERGKNE